MIVYFFLRNQHLLGKKLHKNQKNKAIEDLNHMTRR